MKNAARIHIFVSGEVQGVFFRHSAKERAQKLGLVGFVKNMRDGRVEVVAEGEKEKLLEFASWAKNGPPHARVTNCETVWETPTQKFESFSIE